MSDGRDSYHEGCDLVELTAGDDDISACIRLSDKAGWNQTPADWRMMLSAGRGFGYRINGALVATAIYLPYPPSMAWISMVVVDEAYRRRGLATTLIRKCIAEIESAGQTPILDATVDGRAVYARMGFVDGPSITRFVLTDETGRPITIASGGNVDRIKRAASQSLQAICNMDADVLGGRRGAIVMDVANRSSDRCYVAVDEHARVIGYCLGRQGRRASHIGPVVANDPTDASALISRALVGVEGPVVIDVPDEHGALQSKLVAAGFVVQRRFVRMVLARDEPGVAKHGVLAADMTRMYAIGGPAIG